MRKRYVPGVVIMLGLLGASLYLFTSENAFIEGMDVAHGTVSALGARAASQIVIHDGTNPPKTWTQNRQAIVTFDVDGRSYTSHGRGIGIPKWELGQQTEVYYRRSNPGINRIKRWDELYFDSLLVFHLFLAGLILGLINFAVYKIRGKALS